MPQLKRAISLSVLAVLSATWFWWLRPSALGGRAAYIIVSGVSMEPRLRTGDLAIMLRQDAYAAGEIIAFRVPGGIVIHRIVGGSAEAGFVTQGDNTTGVDPWQPRPESILGRLWLHVPDAGRPLQNLRQPQNLAVLGVLATLLFWGEDRKAQMRRRGRLMAAAMKRSTRVFTRPGRGMELLGIALALTLVMAAIAGYGFMRPITATEAVERLRYVHNVMFQYTVHTDPSILYPSELIGPVGPAANGNQPAPPAIFARLAHSIDVDIAYQLQSELPPEVQGEMGVELRLKAGEAWSKTDTLLSPVPFSQPAASTRVSVNLDEIQAFVTAAVQQTGFNPGVYEISIVPLIRVQGDLGAYVIDEVYAPAFTLLLNQARIVPDAELTHTETKKIEAPVQRAQAVRLLGFELPVVALRLLGVLGTIAGLGVSGLLAAIVFWGAGLDEAEQLRARYGNMVISVVATNFETRQRVEVASIRDLARLAQRDGNIIFREVDHSQPQLFFVPDGQVVYTYRARNPTSQG